MVVVTIVPGNRKCDVATLLSKSSPTGPFEFPAASARLSSRVCCEKEVSPGDFGFRWVWSYSRVFSVCPLSAMHTVCWLQALPRLGGCPFVSMSAVREGLLSTEIQEKGWHLSSERLPSVAVTHLMTWLWSMVRPLVLSRHRATDPGHVAMMPFSSWRWIWGSPLAVERCFVALGQDRQELGRWQVSLVKTAQGNHLHLRVWLNSRLRSKRWGLFIHHHQPRQSSDDTTHLCLGAFPFS